MSDQCQGAVGGCTKVSRGLVVEGVGVQAAATRGLGNHCQCVYCS